MIVIDPGYFNSIRKKGDPFIKDYYVRTYTVNHYHEHGLTPEAIAAKLFLPVELVNEAIEYERTNK